jgi:hypothetical protein
MKEALYVVGASPSNHTNWPRAGLGMKPASIEPWHLRQDNLFSAILLPFYYPRLIEGTFFFVKSINI